MSAHASSSSAASGSRPRAAPSQSVPEQVVGNYAVGETIGRGSFGKVKKGRHLFTGEYVAIKILNRQKLKSANMDKKIHREIEILRMFSHPNICRLYEVISTPTDMYLIMEYIEGGELYDYIVQKGRVREPEARYIFQQVVCAIEYCHHFRVVHRDLKPENILLGPGLQVKLIDFGLANIMKDGEFLTTSCGSPNYAAPEVISGKLYYGPEVDVWSCGVILYALLCGCLPFDEDSIPMLFSKIKKGKFVIPPSMAAGPKELIQQILVVDPLVRLTIPQIRDAAWFNLKLPMRLAYNESIFATPEETRIMAVLANECAKKLNIREKDVRRELEVGSGPAYVAYNILLDVRRRKDIAAEVRELGMEERSRSPHLSSQQSAAGAGQDGRSSGFSPKATERELNLGLMLTQSPAMEVLLDRADATTNKLAYNTCGFVPASAQPEQRGSSILSPRTQTPLSKGSFRITGLSGSQGVDRPGSQSSLTSGSQRRPNPITTAVPSQQLSVSLSDQPRVGSVARKYPMYSAEEESFLVENNYGWRVGLMTDKRADAAFMSVYDVLRLFRMEWKVLAPFKLLCRTTDATWPMLDEVHAQPFSPLPSSPLAAATASTPIRIGQPSKGGAERRSFAGSGSSSPDGGKRMVESAPLPIPRRSPHPTSMLNPSSIASARGGAAAATSSPPTHPVVMTLYLFRIQEKHDKGFLVDFSIERNTLLGFEVVLRLADELVRRVGR